MWWTSKWNTLMYRAFQKEWQLWIAYNFSNFWPVDHIPMILCRLLPVVFGIWAHFIQYIFKINCSNTFLSTFPFSKMPPKLPFWGSRWYWGNQFCRPTCIWVPGEYSLVPLRYSEVPPGAQIHVGLQNWFPSTKWTLKMAILWAFLKIESSTKIGCYNLFYSCIE